MRRYLTKTHSDKEIRELELKVDQFFGVLSEIRWVDALMRSTDLIYEIRFLLRVHKWDEEHWKHKHLSAMIRQIESEVAKEEKERAKVKPLHTPPPKKTSRIQRDLEIAAGIGVIGAAIAMAWVQYPPQADYRHPCKDVDPPAWCAEAYPRGYRK